MFSPAALRIADRLVDPLMALTRAVGDIALGRTAAALDENAAGLLFIRLSRLVAALIRIATGDAHPRARPLVGTPPSRPGAAKAPSSPDAATAPSSPGTSAPTLPRKPGWLLDALPDLAPATAAELATLLADPALAELLDAAPSLARALHSVTRSLGLAPPPAAAPAHRGRDGAAPSAPSARPRAPAIAPTPFPNA